MGMSIKNEETEQLVRELARRKKVGMTAAVRIAVSNELARTSAPKKDPEKILAAVREIQARVAKMGSMPSMEEMDAGTYDENGLPH